MKLATVALIEATPWERLGTAVGPASRVSEALLALIQAVSQDEAEEAYWGGLDNMVIVQGTLYESAVHVIAPLAIEISSNEMSEGAKRWSVELLAEIALAVSDVDSTDDLEARVVEECRNELTYSQSVFYGLLDDEQIEIRSAAVFTLSALCDRGRVGLIFSRLDPDRFTLQAQREIQRNLADASG